MMAKPPKLNCCTRNLPFVLLCNSEVAKKNKILSHNTLYKDGILCNLASCSVICGILIRDCEFVDCDVGSHNIHLHLIKLLYENDDEHWL